MTAIDYTRFDERQLDRLYEQSKAFEQDLERRVARRLQDSNPDPIAKRLRFLLAKFRNRTREVERQLARYRAHATQSRSSVPPAAGVVPHYAQNRAAPAMAAREPVQVGDDDAYRATA